MIKKTVPVTGGSSRIGLAVTLVLAEQDTWRALALFRNKGKQEEAKRLPGAAAENEEFVSGETCDLTSCNPVTKWIDPEFGRLDSLVNWGGPLSLLRLFCL
jgi:NAD(P)-dependent dehydrogenase (short-subunit alcohol dehydrogenase family)